MDPRQPQHPFSRNNPAPYGRAPFPPSSNTAPFPPASLPQHAQPQFPEHQRRTSDGQYYPPPRTYPQDGPSMSAPSHSRHQSSSSIGHGTPAPAHRQMPPPSSPQQTPHSYPPPISRGPPPSLGTPMSYSHGQNLPPISSHIPNLHRPSSTTGSSMSISALIGGPVSSSREPGAHSQYPPPPSSATPLAYSGPMQQSPRTHASEYPAYQKPQTPDLPRPHELSGPRDHRANSAGSPPHGPPQTSPIDTHRYSTPQTYSHRSMPPQQGPASSDDRREHYLARVPNPSAPPRPNSQPMAMNGPSPQLANVGRSDISGYGRSNGISEREAYMQAVDRDRAEREGALREREREQREREIQIDRERMVQIQASQGQPYPHQQQHPQQQQFNRPPPEREQPPWMRPGYEQMPPDQRPQQQVPVSSAGYDYPRTTQAPYGSTPMYAPDHRYPPATQGPSQQGPPNARYEGPTQEEHRQQVQLQQQQQQEQQQQQQQQQRQQQPAMYNAPPGAYPQQHDSPQRRPEEAQMQQQRNFLGPPQEINRKGRLSPLPQAVQGAQGQLSIPGGEPGIKSEFGRMFSGIGSGAGSTMPTPSPGNSQLPFSNPQLRREDLEAVTAQEQSKEGGRRWPSPGSGSRGGRRRKPKEEDKGGDDESIGRQTPSVRSAKRTKVAHHNSSTHQAQSNHHNHEPTEETTSQTLASFKSAKEPHGSTATPQPSHSHHHHAPPSSTPLHPPEVTIPLPKRIITSAPVLASVAHLPRMHLGNGLYTSVLTPGGPPSPDNTHSGRGYTSMSNSIPRFEGKENCTFTIKVPRLYLEDEVRMEITARRQVWGTDVYTDDSDVLAACIHGGWFRGAWSPDIDVSLLGLEIEEPLHEKKGRRKDKEPKKKMEFEDLFNLFAPPVHGPRDPMKELDVELKILILPALEKYTSTTRFGIKSRGWKEGHDGGSFKILSVRFVDGFGPAGTVGVKLNGMSGRGASRRERIREWFEDGGDEFGDVGKVKWVMKKDDVPDDRKKGTESEASASTLKDADVSNDVTTASASATDVHMASSAELNSHEEVQREQGRDQEGTRKAAKLNGEEKKPPSLPTLFVYPMNRNGNVKGGIDADGASEPKSNGAGEPEVLVRESNVRNES